jgi:hypothetical protein
MRDWTEVSLCLNGKLFSFDGAIQSLLSLVISCPHEALSGYSIAHEAFITTSHLM